MRELALVLLGFAAMVGVGYLSDKQTLVPPPDAVAEGFFRAVVNHRPPIAREYLASPESVSDGDVRSLQHSIYYRCAGEVNDVESETVSRTEEQALVTTRLQSDQGSTAMNVHLVWTRGGWKLKGLPTG